VRLRGPSPPHPHLPARRVRGLPAPQGLPAPLTRGQALAWDRRRRGPPTGRGGPPGRRHPGRRRRGRAAARGGRLMAVTTDPQRLACIANITLFIGTMGADLGAVTPVFYAFRDREHVLNQIEGVTGGRFHPNFDRIGGLKDDLPRGWIDETKAVMVRIREFCNELEELLMGNEIFQARARGIGVIPADVGLSYGLSGAHIRASLDDL